MKEIACISHEPGIMFSSIRALLRLSFAVLCMMMIGPASTCFPNQVGSCPHYQSLSYPDVTIIPLPKPVNLTQNCRQLTSGLKCLVGPSVLGRCPEAAKALYSTMIKVLKFPCDINKQEYLSGTSCWESQDISTMMSGCFLQSHGSAAQGGYCDTQRQFVECVTTTILTIPNCGAREQRLIDTMLKTNYNSLAVVMDPPCDLLTLPEEHTTTETIETTTPTTTMPSVASSTPPGINSSKKTGLDVTVKAGATVSTSRTSASRSGGDGLLATGLATYHVVLLSVSAFAFRTV